MHRFHWTIAVGMLLAAAASVDGQVVRGVISVTQSHMS